MTSRIELPALAEPESPQPLQPTPGPHRPFPSPTPHITIRQASYVPIPYVV